MTSSALLASPLLREDSLRRREAVGRSLLHMTSTEPERTGVSTPPSAKRAADNDSDLAIAASQLSISSDGARGSPSPQLLVQVLVDGAPEHQAYSVVGSETIKELKMKLSKKSWFTSKHCLVFGDRELKDNQSVADIMQQIHTSGNSSYLHIFVRTRDVQYARFLTNSASASFGSIASLERHSSFSDLPLALPAPPDSSPPVSPRALIPVAPLLTCDAHAAAAPPPPSDVLHIIIRKTAEVSWHAAPTGEFELRVSVAPSDTATSVKRRALTVARPRPRGASPAPPPAAAPSIHADVHLVHNGRLLASDRPLISYGLRDGDVVDLVPWTRAAAPRALPAPPPPADCRGAVPAMPLAVPTPLESPEHGLFRAWQSALLGLKAGFRPNLATAGSGGSYFLRGPDGATVAVFKPSDEEPRMANNPRGYTPPAPSVASRGGSCSSSGGRGAHCAAGVAATPLSGLRRGVRPGEGFQREIAAYLLDHGHRAGVPATAPVFLALPDGSAKLGSLQQFVVAERDCEEMGSAHLPVAEVHKIAIFDLRLANADRNGSNLLARRDAAGTWRLTPIDHGFCLPDTFEDMAFEWSAWPQARQPLSADDAAFVAALCPQRDLALLAEHDVHLRPACGRVFRATTRVLQKVAARGLPPIVAADLLERRSLRKSRMEKMHRVACDRACMVEAEAQRGSGGPGSGAGDGVDAPARRPPARRSSGGGTPVSDEVYLRHLEMLLDEYLDSVVEAVSERERERVSEALAHERVGGE